MHGPHLITLLLLLFNIHIFNDGCSDWCYKWRTPTGWCVPADSCPGRTSPTFFCMFSQIQWPLVADRRPQHNALRETERQRDRGRWVIQFVDKKVSWYGNSGCFIVSRIYLFYVSFCCVIMLCIGSSQKKIKNK
jgi:hypothetical protein